EDIRTTLDHRGCLEQLPFMPEMLPMCGRRAIVFRSMHRLFDYRKSRRMRHMHGAVLLVNAVCDGGHHGGCQARCHTIWKSAWLRRIEPDHGLAAPHSAREPPADEGLIALARRESRYVCQLTELHAASRPISNRSFFNALRPLLS